MTALDEAFFKESFLRSLGDLYKDFYSEKEITLLIDELKSKYKEKPENKGIHVSYFIPGENDELLRLRLDCIIITCNSLPFFTATIRRYIKNSKDLSINRSLHFHPSETEELYYIEIHKVQREIIEKAIRDLEQFYYRILKLTADFNTFSKVKRAEWSGLWPKHAPLIEWLLDKSYVWEGSLQLIEARETLYGEVDDWVGAKDWFLSLPESDEERFFALESKDTAFLADGELFYFAFITGKNRLLLSGSLNEVARYSGLKDLPILKANLDKLYVTEKIQEFSGLGRTVRMTFNFIPTELLFIIPFNAYHPIYTAIMDQSLKTNLGVTGMQITEDISLIISFIPEKNWSEEVWEGTDKIVEEFLSPKNFKAYHVLKDRHIEGYHIIRGKNIGKQQLFEVASRIEFSFRTWDDNLRYKWEDRYKDIPYPESILFRKDYSATHSPEMAIHDLDLLLKMGHERLICNVVSRNEATIIEAITRDREFSLSLWVQALANFGLSPISQRVYRFYYENVLYAKSEFFLEEMEDRNDLYQRLKTAFTFTMKGLLPSDKLSSLLLHTNLDAHGLFFLKAIRDYCLQSNPAFHIPVFNSALLTYPEFCVSTWEYFCDKFEKGNIPQVNRMKELADKTKTIKEDESLTAFRTSVLSILRTNFFSLGSKEIISNKKGVKGLDRGSIAFKIDSSIPAYLPSPRPYREIFVYSSEFQGIHLRGGPVARGGLRFSDRNLDYRTEILSLMKTQMVKNALIVPVGSKGGFILSENIYSKTPLAMVEAYKKYINSLLALTDNRKKGELIPFAETSGPYAYDDADPYLVVAADKGTAQLSDTANSLSIERGFWLGDAFASGGSRGYSHKELGITAKGALVTGDRLFRNLKVDFRTESIRLVGIGDMGGDVFGNGLLESQHFQLIAAFNHKHIFLDPNPDSNKSYEERKRLFFSKDSGWDFYNKDLISKGGGIFDKTEKAITISAEVKEALGITADSLSGTELIRAILKAPIDMLYNGGIGTYIKASTEDNNEVGDPSNNELRINGKEVRAKVITEGGNLGLTQKGRIEFDRNGGFIFTDAMDNSGGVDLSDHEVNLKLFFNLLIEEGLIRGEDERDEIMKDIVADVVKKVLLHNASQSLSVNVDSYESIKKGWRLFTDTADHLISKKILNPQNETIPGSESEWQEWKAKGNAIPRPALCVLFGYVKMDLYSESLKYQLFKAEDYPEMFLSYFPKKLGEKYRNMLFKHPLKNEIMATQIVNFYVDLMGVGSYLLLGKEKDTRINRLKEIVDSLYQNKVYLLQEELASLRNKELESDLNAFLSSLREGIRKQYSMEATEKPEEFSIFQYISSDAKTVLKGIL
ncbi:MAG: NAD-glutamate dehydrogenase [Leptospiraceae bacterium]|nr:NAD-glutamate dehydrogenase [Leptospiraceae bacterium]MCP5502066.1 NAD-glutamate dehydrogenase [Leptospiraceae bacterium]